MKLGADCQKVLRRPANARNPIDPLYERFGLFDKSAKELAAMSGNYQGLVNVMQEYDTREAKIEKCLCRCGSRLPWRQCHSGELIGQVPHYFVLDPNDKRTAGASLAFRYAPLARCPCNATGKTCYTCCWKSTPEPHYQNDANANLFRMSKIVLPDNPASELLAQYLNQRKEEIKDSGEDLNQVLFPELANMSKDEARKYSCDFIRRVGSMEVLQSYTSPHPNSMISSWDAHVVAGTMERIDNFFQWSDVHWSVDKIELLLRVDEWNTALELYCNDQGLSGAKREAVVAKHTAGPYAPCGNALCNLYETEVKEFRRCSVCKKISYCCVACQRQDWKRHKQQCQPIGFTGNAWD